MARIVCVGSMNHDITVRVRRRPLPDETLHGESVAEYRGGKGANQIVAAARLGAETAMVACVGEDSRGDFLVEGLVEDGVDTTHVHRVGEPLEMRHELWAHVHLFGHRATVGGGGATEVRRRR